MDTAAHRHCLREITPHHNPASNNVRVHAVSAMRGPLPLSIKLVPMNIITLRRRINRNPARTFNTISSMGDEGGASTTEIPPIEAVEKKEEAEKSVKEVPPPPEKPEPGDCCGSGCVRCVWDVYYDELDEYNKLYKNDSNSW